MSEGPARRRYGPLDCIVFDAPGADKTIVLFHGYGADAADLAPLAREIRLARLARWVFPNAPLQLELGFLTSGRAWFPLDMAAFEEAQRKGEHRDLSGAEPPGLAQTRALVESFLAALGGDFSRLVLGGFSQGAILATDLSLRALESPLGLAILSGNLMNEKEWRALAPSRKGLPFFQSHGFYDPLLGHAGAQRLEKLLREAGLAGSLFSFEGGHEISLEVLDKLTVFLDSLA